MVVKVENIDHGRWYVQCETHRTYTLASEPESKKLMFRHIKVFPTHLNVTCFDSLENLELLQESKYREVEKDDFNR